MDWQLVAALAVVLGAALYLGRAVVGFFQARKDCGGSCGCAKATSATKPNLIPVGELRVRRR